ncbi:cytochrome c-type biogenesis protein CcmH [Shewanella sp. D64]|uniref:cytochrome c-type biogenesis protein n=1 Tax=unclassified Shewanella TaxID=196818 RepID=UPI0022BA1DD2|nr:MULTISPECIES: cytochrome c-type biogenesis protein [unclassified Shewanella]MEC4728005.1 cytochrome c-type biogenesis protein CcmH [Shewanella sp. D64]MEC4740150.1 cytochrome c-type biogenesis protein CcmH [Shewanella sp. E94]WBJ95209.1 cytochrome c-type biogenesis protein CcmH [Shewanella sp. MTB7]
MNRIALNMSTIRAWLAVVLLFSASLSVSAVTDVTDKIQYTQEQIRDLGFEIAHELRCPMSVNQNLFDSGAPIASELKGQIFLMLEQGESKQTIIDFLVQRYGEKIRYQPSLSIATAALWFGPILLLFGIIGFTAVLIREQRKHQDTNGDIYE